MALNEGQLLESPVPALLEWVTGLKPVPPGVHVMLKSAGVRSTQRLAIGSPGGGIVVCTWPAELQPQAKYLYQAGRARRLLEAAEAGGWEVEARPHLGFWNAPAGQRLYMSPTIPVAEYVARWAGSDQDRIGEHAAETIRGELWPWLLRLGYASDPDTPELEPFLRRLGRRPAHLRAGLRLLRRWRRDEVVDLRSAGTLAGVLRAEVNRLLKSVGDPLLPAS
jgi:hypothetical protein